jgi:tRNA threonylcarbamoyladenosine biosynthesis protein TsaB
VTEGTAVTAPWILALDASTPRSVLVLGRVHDDRDELVLTDALVDQPNQASSTLLPRAEEILRRAGIAARELAAVACGRGPGTFTGTRVAIASTMGLCLGVGCPAIGVSTLAAVAASAVFEAGRDDRVLALLDARRGEVYGGVWDCKQDARGRAVVSACTQEHCATIDAVLDALAPDLPLRAIGPGVEPSMAAITARGLEAIVAPGPTGEGLWRATAAAWRAGMAAPPEDLRAVYLRQSYAELGVNAPRRAFVKSPFV